MSMNIRKRWREWRNSVSHASDLAASERRAEASANRLKTLEYASAAVVFSGILAEYAPPFKAALPKLGLWLSLKSVWPGATIALGIAGEISFSMLASSREKTIASFSAQRRADAERKTAEALREAASANLLAERERVKRVKIEEWLTPLTVSDDQQMELTERFRPFRGRTIEMHFLGGKNMDLSTGLLRALRNAEVNVQFTLKDFLPDPDPALSSTGDIRPPIADWSATGVSIEARSEDMPLAQAIVTALKDARVIGPLTTIPITRIADDLPSRIVILPKPVFDARITEL